MRGAALQHLSDQRGMTLVELVMTIVIISVAIAGVIGAFSLAAGRSSDVLSQVRAIELAQLYADEIMARRYDESTGSGGTPVYAGSCNIGADAGESRATFDDVDDYHSTDDQPPRSADGAISGFSDFRVQVSVVCAGTGLGLAQQNAKRIDLLVTAPGGYQYDFSVYRVNF